MLQLAQDPDADALLDRDPLALLIGMLLDQQFPMERAFAGPAGLARRLGVDRLDARALAEYDPEALAAVFTGPPALHRYPAAMAGRVQALAALLVDRYDGDARRALARRPGRRHPAPPAQGPPRVRCPEGADLRRAAGQAARGDAAGLAGGRRGVRRRGVVPLGRRRRRRGVARPRPRVQAGGEGAEEGGCGFLNRFATVSAR